MGTWRRQFCTFDVPRRTPHLQFAVQASQDSLTSSQLTLFLFSFLSQFDQKESEKEGGEKERNERELKRHQTKKTSLLLACLLNNKTVQTGFTSMVIFSVLRPAASSITLVVLALKHESAKGVEVFFGEFFDRFWQVAVEFSGNQLKVFRWVIKTTRGSNTCQQEHMSMTNVNEN